MALGPDSKVCTAAFVAAMRARLNELDPPAGANVDRPDVHDNLAALGSAVYDVLTGTGKAETGSAAAQDPAFWAWVAALTAHVAALDTWQRGVVAAATAWTPADPSSLAFKAALLALPSPGAGPAAPTSLVGRIR